MTPKQKFESRCSKSNVTFVYNMHGRKVVAVNMTAPAGNTFRFNGQNKKTITLAREDYDTAWLYKKAVEVLNDCPLWDAASIEYHERKQEEEARNGHDASTLHQMIEEKAKSWDIKVEYEKYYDDAKPYFRVHMTAPAGKKFSYDRHKIESHRGYNLLK